MLCIREVQNSIKESVHSLLASIINSDDNLQRFFRVTDTYIQGANGSIFIFKGLHNTTADSIKSIHGVQLVWVEEAHMLSRRSLDILIPTIREINSFFIFSLNPDKETDPVYEDYILTKRDDTAVLKVNYYDNEFCPQELKDLAEQDRRNKPDKYRHIWEGETKRNSDAQIFKGCYEVREFDVPEKVFLYQGLDFGFSQDPTAFNQMFVLNNELYIRRELHGHEWTIQRIYDEIARVPDALRYPILADSARPDTINELRLKGLNIRGAQKGKGSIEDGIEHIKSYDKVVIHPDCEHTIDEYDLYSYIVDKKTGLISDKPEDAFNHHIDNIRYGLSPRMKGAVKQNFGRTRR